MEMQIEPVVKRLTVPINPERAFELFTAGFARWWPTDTHSVNLENTKTCVFEAKKEGRIYEVGPDGEVAMWGSVLEIDPPASVVFTWHPGRDATTAQRVQVTFTESGSGTEVVLHHSGFEALGDRAVETRDGYDTGWELVLIDRYGRACNG